MKLTVLAVFILLFCVNTNAQYTVNGNATQDDCHCYTLTNNAPNQRGSVWNNNKIDLSQSFTFTFDVFLGCNDGGADGIAFVLQPISTSVGGTGSGMGYGGILPAAGVTLDTYQNSSPDADPFYDHIAIQLNGDVNHTSANTITPLTEVSATNINVEDCNWHILKIEWNASALTLSVFFDGMLRVSATNDLVNTVFGGNSFVYWGFTGATGALTNQQKFCTSLTPNFHLLPGQVRCIGEPITFYDSTITFGGILKRYWNFGDGSPIDSVNTDPIHTYAVAGDFTVTLTVIAIDSCIETFSQQIRVGSKPIANFSATDTCVGLQVNFLNQSTATVGTVDSWYWDFDNGNTSTSQNPSTTYSLYGNKNVKLVVRSAEGCASDTLTKIITAYARPVLDFTFTDSVCLGTPTYFTHNITVPGGSTIAAYSWVFQDTTVPVYNQNTSHVFLNPGVNQVLLTALTNHSCFNVLTKPVFVSDRPIAFFITNFVCQGSALTIQDSAYTNDGTTIAQWWWDLGNGQNSTLQNPLVIYTTPGIKTIKQVVWNSRGCISDTVTRYITVSEKPTASFTADAAVCFDEPVVFDQHSTIINGSLASWSWTESGIQWSSQQEPSQIFTQGVHTVGLAVTSNEGCISDTFYQTFTINPRPGVNMSFESECKNTPVIFTGIITSGTADEWHWHFGDGSTGSTPTPTHTYTANGLYNVSVYATDIYGCNSNTVAGVINIYGTNAFAGYDTIAASGQPLQLHASGGLSYEWSPAVGLSNASIADPVAILQSTRTYLLKAYTPEGCESFDEVTIKIYDGPEIYLPNAFTPNNDGLNDQLRGIPVGIKVFHYLKIFNRWGQLIYSTSDYSKGWDGNFKGAKQESGVYVVVTSGIDFTGKQIMKRSTVMLIR